MEKCNECGIDLDPFLNSTKPGGCCIQCEEEELNWRHVSFGQEEDIEDDELE